MQTTLFISAVLLAVTFGSAIAIQLLLFPTLMGRVQDKSTVTRVSSEILKRHHTLSIILIAAATVLLLATGKWIPGIVTAILLLLNLYQRFWVFTKMHLVKQPIGVQDLIQPDNVLREEFNRLHKTVYWLFRIHMILLLIDLCLFAF